MSIKRFVLPLAVLTLAFRGYLHAGEPIPFSSEQSYAKNFRAMPDVTLLRFDGEALWAKRSKTFYGGALYEPGGKAALFDSGSAEASFALEGELSNRTLFYLVARFDEENGTAVVARVVVTEPSRARLVILFKTDPYAKPQQESPQILVDWEYNLRGGGGYYRDALNKDGASGGQVGRTIALGQNLVARLEQRETPTRAFCLTLLDDVGELIATTGFQSHEQLSAVAARGSVGMGALVSPTDAIRINSFSVEPSK